MKPEMYVSGHCTSSSEGSPKQEMVVRGVGCGGKTVGVGGRLWLWGKDSGLGAGGAVGARLGVVGGRGGGSWGGLMGEAWGVADAGAWRRITQLNSTQPRRTRAIQTRQGRDLPWLSRCML